MATIKPSTTQFREDDYIPDKSIQTLIDNGLIHIVDIEADTESEIKNEQFRYWKNDYATAVFTVDISNMSSHHLEILMKLRASEIDLIYVNNKAIFRLWWD